MDGRVVVVAVVLALSVTAPTPETYQSVLPEQVSFDTSVFQVCGIETDSGRMWILDRWVYGYGYYHFIGWGPEMEPSDPYRVVRP